MQYLSKCVPTRNNAKKEDVEKSEITDISFTNESLDEALVQRIYETIGNNVKNIRTQKNISQLELSHLIGHKSVSVISCAEICHKNYHFNIEHLVKIAGALDVPICEFFHGVDDMIENVKKVKKLYELV